MRRLLVLGALGGLAIATPASANRPSNPAFLGISMIDARAMAALQLDGCVVESVTRGSGAEAAGLRQGDVIQSIDGKMSASCVQLTEAIQEHAPGDLIAIHVVRNGEKATLRATLSSRAEILHRRFVDHTLESTRAVEVDDGHDLDLSDIRGGTTVLAWFDARHCGGCSILLQQLGDALHEHKRGAAGVQLMGVTAGSIEDFAATRQSMQLGVPLLVVEPELFANAVTSDEDRLFIMVLDSHGIVRFVTPIAPEDDAVDSTIDEIAAAAEQSEHARARR